MLRRLELQADTHACSYVGWSDHMITWQPARPTIATNVTVGSRYRFAGIRKNFFSSSISFCFRFLWTFYLFDLFSKTLRGIPDKGSIIKCLQGFIAREVFGVTYLSRVPLTLSTDLLATDSAGSQSSDQLKSAVKRNKKKSELKVAIDLFRIFV